MIDTDFEKDSRAHSFWQEWQSAADQQPDNTPRREGDEMSDYIASINPDWAFVVAQDVKATDCCTDTGGHEGLVWADNIKKYA